MSRVVFAFFLCVSSLWARDLVVGMQLQFPPFETIDTEGKPKGISVELAEALGGYLGERVVIQDYPFIGLIPALQAKHIDCIISSMSVTAERLKAIDFSNPYIKTGLCLLINAKSTLQGIEDADQKGRVIAVKQGTTGELYALSHLKKAKVLSLGEEAACVLEVVQGKADAFIYDQFSVYMHWKENPTTTRAILKPFKEEEWAIGLRKDDPLKNKINLFLSQFLSSGKMKALVQQYYNIPMGNNE
jgi:polar amino acid transport system substrate-binding protein